MTVILLCCALALAAALLIAGPEFVLGLQGIVERIQAISIRIVEYGLRAFERADEAVARGDIAALALARRDALWFVACAYVLAFASEVILAIAAVTFALLSLVRR